MYIKMWKSCASGMEKRKIGTVKMENKFVSEISTRSNWESN